MIPEQDRVIQGLWVDGELSAMEELCIRSFLANGHEFHLYTYGDVPNAPSGATVRDAREILPEDRIFRYEGGEFGKGSLAGFADLFRYQLLFDRGGWWVDMDVICLKPFAFGRESIVATSWEPSLDNPVSLINNCVLRAAPGDALMSYCLAAFEKMDATKVKFGETGPELVKRGVKELDALDRLVPWQTFCPIGYRDARHLVTPLFTRLLHGRVKAALRGRPQVRLPGDSVAVHMWNEMWRQNGLDKRAVYPAGSIYERLKARYLG